MLLSDEADQFFFICGGKDFHECDPVHGPHDGHDVPVDIRKILAVFPSRVVYCDETHYLRLYVNYLRKKLEANPSDPKYILTERGVGYRFVDYKRERDRKAKDS